jgi:xanthine dehydrogenase FAD-binding subunit
VVSARRPASLAEGLSLLSEESLIPMAGGTDLMAQGKRSAGLSPVFARPVLFVGHIEELRGVRAEGPRLRIGAACTFASLIENVLVPAVFKEVAAGIAAPAIRNRGTVGGNVCNASPAGDTLPYLYALDAELLLRSGAQARIAPVRDFITGPGRTSREENELCTEILLPLVDFNVCFYRKVGARRANACAKLSFLGLARVEGGAVEDVRVCFGAVAPTVVRSRAIEEGLAGLTTRQVRRRASEVAGDYEPMIRPVDDRRSSALYRKTVSLRLLEYFLGEVIGTRD